MRKKYWAAPLNAAHIKKWKETVKTLSKDDDVETKVPDITDNTIKQVLLPFEQSYVSTTPVQSLGLLHEIYWRLSEKSLIFKEVRIQPSAAATSNHGDLLLQQTGNIRSLVRGPLKIKQSEWKGDCVQLTARCERMNLGSAMISSGFPAITAIGGAVHTIERATNLDIEFAVGFRNLTYINGVQKQTILNGKVPRPAFNMEEIRGSCDIVLLLRSSNNLEKIAHALKQLTRIAGGDVFNSKIDILNDKKPEQASYIIDSSKKINTAMQLSDYKDNLDCALGIYAKNGFWRDREWIQADRNSTINHTGYAFLEEPTERKYSRSNYLHVWSEPVFSLVTQNNMRETAWWKRVSTSKSGVFWGRVV